MPDVISKESRIYIAGHNGLIGSALMEKLGERGYNRLITRSHAELDLTRQKDVLNLFEKEKPEYVILNAAIPANSVNTRSNPVGLMLDNTLIIANVVDAALRFGVKKMIYVCSHAAYPSDAEKDQNGFLQEEAMQPGKILNPRERYYSMPKLLGEELCRAINSTGKMRCVTAILANVYGINYHYDVPDRLPVFPALMKRFCEAVRDGTPEVVVWGTGNLRRDLLFVDDVAQAYITLLENEDTEGLYNISSGNYITVREMAETICKVTGYSGRIVFDTTKPDGTEFPLLRLDRIKSLGWRQKVKFEDGVKQAYEYYKKCVEGQSAVSNR